MAQNLQKYLAADNRPPLRVWNRTLSKCQSIVDLGAILESDGPAVLAQRCDIIFSMVFDDDALRALVDVIVGANKRPNLMFIDCSTVYPTTTKECAEKMKANGVRYLSCPMFGRPDAALAKMLVGSLAGAPADKVEVRPYLDAMTRGVIDVGNEPHMANAEKLVGNFIILSAIEVLAEAQTLAEKAGLSRQNVMDFVDTMLPVPVFQGYGSRMANDDFQITDTKAGFPVRGGLKDATYMKRLATEADAKLPILDVAINHMQKQKENGRDELDWGSLVLSVREESGLSGDAPK
ncbi:hypothetical protein HK097_000714 [Rhizophlyctis rosea]|uniref:6-phosphogluconate dehydrogenase n=1 Tax=Rhizophlyctis rosea TaxID=64517 RepID=A0AAD5S7S3_9FUNG|nr:hypothetical protein HK097_000714 [Rhizophlyctis rosea]